MDVCSSCGKELPPEFSLVIPRIPCPDCRRTGRCLARHGNEYLHTTDSLSWTQTRPGIQSAAQLDDQGKIILTATGPSPKNEEDGLETCARFVRMLNSVNGNWTEPVKGPEEPIDGLSFDRGTGQKLEMQVIRASNNGKMWQAVNDVGSVTVNFDAAKAAAELIGAIRKKSARYSATQKKSMMLLLDSGRTPGHSFQLVFDTFRARHFDKCQKAGFAQVWAVGPHDGLVVRLDQQHMAQVEGL